jgi:hypothetical protein
MTTLLYNAVDKIIKSGNQKDIKFIIEYCDEYHFSGGFLRHNREPVATCYGYIEEFNCNTTFPFKLVLVTNFEEHVKIDAAELRREDLEEHINIRTSYTEYIFDWNKFIESIRLMTRLYKAVEKGLYNNATNTLLH